VFSINMKFLLGTKGRMTQVFDEGGVVTPATVVNAGTLTVTQVKGNEKDGYGAVQVGFGEKKEKNIAKAQKGHLKDLGMFRYMREFASTEELKRGDTIDVSTFEEGDMVTVSAISKGKGFQGVVKRHNFAGGPRTHGQKHSERAPGSIGAQGPQRVFKGKRMAGRMGGDRVTVKNLKVLQVDKETGTIVISGAIPGRPGTLVEVRG
jgi:large subunit ribosomal protein L3